MTAAHVRRGAPARPKQRKASKPRRASARDIGVPAEIPVHRLGHG